MRASLSPNRDASSQLKALPMVGRMRGARRVHPAPAAAAEASSRHGAPRAAAVAARRSVVDRPSYRDEEAEQRRS